MKKLTFISAFVLVFIHLTGQEVTLDLKVFLEGPFNGTGMSTVLNSTGQLPLSQPYSSSPWNYEGIEAVTSIPSAEVVDWVLIDLITPTGSIENLEFEIVGRKAGFLLNNGFIRNLDGISYLPVNLYPATDIYICVHHRNHLSIISSQTLFEPGGEFNYDFTDAASKVIGGSQALKNLGSGIWGMMAADGDASRQINNLDKNEVWLPQRGQTGYKEGDFNMDSQVNDSDPLKWKVNAGRGFSFIIRHPSIDFNCGEPIRDIRDGQQYNTVQIGDQCWMAENLNIGSLLEGNTGMTDNSVIEKYCFYDNEGYCDEYGGLYQWDEVMQYSLNSGAKGLCPSGWHVPADEEYCTLATTVDPTVICGTMDWTGIDAGIKLMEAGSVHWLNPIGTNESGFTGLPGGFCENGYFDFLGFMGHWWTSSTVNGNHPLWMLETYHVTVGRWEHQSNYGFSVRCIKNCSPQPTPSSAGPDLLNIPGASAILQGNVPTEGTGQWSIVNGTGGNISDPSNPTSLFTGLPGNTYNLSWTITNDCGSSIDDVVISFAEFSCNNSFVDIRDNRVYNTVQIGDQCWMKENLDIGTRIDVNIGQQDNTILEKHCYENSFENCELYGGLYQWNEMMQYVSNPGVQGICPAGWHVPTDGEWTSLSDFLGGESIAGGLMKTTGTIENLNGLWYSPNAGATNSSGFSALPAGYASVSSGLSYFKGYAGLIWSSTQGENTSVAWIRKLTTWNSELNRNSDYLKVASMSVRCIKDCETQPTQSNAGPDQLNIPGTSVALQANTPVNGTGQWSIIGGTGGTITTPTDPISNFSGLPGASYTLRWTISNSCGSSTDDVEISFCPVLTIADAGPDQLNLLGESATMNANQPIAGIGGWSVVSETGPCFFIDWNNPTSSFIGEIGGIYTLRWTIETACGSSSDDVTISFLTCGMYFFDTRDNIWYLTTQIGTQCWMAENLNTGIMATQQNNGINEKSCYDDNPANCLMYGGLYTWDEMMQYTSIPGEKGICPTGWHLPSDSEWETLITYLGGYDVAGGKMKENYLNYWQPPNTGATNSSGFTALPGGAYDADGKTFPYLYAGYKGVFWSSNSAYDPFSLSYDNAGVNNNYWFIQRASVRCISDCDVPPTQSNAGPDQIDLSGTSATLQGNTPSAGIGQWSIVSGTGGSITTPASPISIFTGLAGYSYTLRWTISTACASNSDDVVISFSFSCGSSFLDTRNNQVYNTVQEGVQCWMKQNMDIGTMVSTGANQTNNGVIEKYCYDNNENNCSVYGGLYQWNEMMLYSTTEGIKGICPMGWHLPTDAEWSTLKNYVNSQPSFLCNSNINYISKALASDYLWSEHSAACAPGNNQMTNNATGFSGLPAGFCSPGFNGLGLSGLVRWWSSTQSSSTESYERIMRYDYPTFDLGNTEKENGLSVRCLRDCPTPPTQANAGSDQYNVSGDYTTLQGNMPTEGWGLWSIVSGTGGAIEVAPAPTTLFYGLPGNSYTLRWTITTICASSFDDVIISFCPTLTIANAGPDQLNLANTTTTLQGNTPVAGSGIWSIVSGTGGNITTPSSPTSSFTGVAGNAYTLRWTITTSCGSTTDDVILSFANFPVVNTSAISNISYITATGGGNVTSEGGLPVTARGVCWSTVPGPTINDSHTNDGTGIGSFTSNLSGLSSNTYYYFRAYATNNVGTAYGNQLTFTTLDPCAGVNQFTYGSKDYNTIRIGTQCWMKENLDIGYQISGSTNQTDNLIMQKYCYDDLASNCNVFGGLYQWNEMMQYTTTQGTKGICQTGWHLPTNAEWNILRDYLGGSSVAGGKMKEIGFTYWYSPNTGATNSSGFTAFGGGNCAGGVFDYKLEYGAFWSSTENGTNAYGRILSNTSASISVSNEPKIKAGSVRCLKD